MYKYKYVLIYGMIDSTTEKFFLWRRRFFNFQYWFYVFISTPVMDNHVDYTITK